MKSFDTINRSNRHTSGFALRFFRIKRIRDDKTVRDIDTIEGAMFPPCPAFGGTGVTSGASERRGDGFQREVIKLPLLWR